MRGNAAARELIMIGSEVEALFRRGVAGHAAALGADGVGGDVVQRGVADADDGEVFGAAPAPVLK